MNSSSSLLMTSSFIISFYFVFCNSISWLSFSLLFIFFTVYLFSWIFIFFEFLFLCFFLIFSIFFLHHELWRKPNRESHDSHLIQQFTLRFRLNFDSSILRFTSDSSIKRYASLKENFDSDRTILNALQQS